MNRTSVNRDAVTAAMQHFDKKLASRGDRLKAARERAGFESARSAALAFGWTVSTYGAHENGRNDFSEEQSQRYARAFHVDPTWLFTGRTIYQPGPSLVPLVGYVGAGAGLHYYGSGQGAFDEVPAPPYGNRNTVAVEVRGNSMYGIAQDGWVIYYDDVRSIVTDDLIGELCVVWLPNDEALIKLLHRGSAPGLFDLESSNAPTIHDVEVLHAAQVTCIIPASVARRQAKRNRDAVV
jgi:phage repressor protein C with HTH and peptisase S24 domain